jgi:antirestriction protein ArdC
MTMHKDKRVAALQENVLELAAAVADPTQTDEVFENYMRWAGQLHQRYSFANTALILRSIHTARFVAGYRRLKTMGYQVRYGQKGVAILVPLHAPGIEQTDPLSDEPVIQRPIVGFSVGHVFDISQCDGPPVPNFKHDLSEDARPLLDAAVALAEEQGIEVEFRTLMGSTNGLSQLGKIVINSACPVGVQAQVILHELAHEQMHPVAVRTEASRALHEGEAEGCAWATLQRFGIGGTMLNSAAYIRSHLNHTGDSRRSVLQSLERISSAAHDLIAGLERHLPQDLKPPLLTIS